MKVELLAPATDELRDAALYYEGQKPGLGKELTHEVRVALDRIARWPLSGAAVTGGARRVRVKRFPYALIYFIENEAINVAAVMHLHREPDYWIERLPGSPDQ